MIEKLIEALDAQNPRWWREMAEPSDLQDYVEQSSAQGWVNVTLEARGERVVRAIITLKHRTAERLFIVLRAAVHSGLLVEPKETV